MKTSDVHNRLLSTMINNGYTICLYDHSVLLNPFASPKLPACLADTLMKCSLYFDSVDVDCPPRQHSTPPLPCWSSQTTSFEKNTLPFSFALLFHLLLYFDSFAVCYQLSIGSYFPYILSEFDNL